MQKSLSLKLAAIAALSLLLLIPLLMVQGKISERASFRSIARAELAQSWVASQRLMTPVLVMPYTQSVPVGGFVTKQDTQRTKKQGRLLVLPEQVSLRAALDSERRYKGIYQFPVYSADIQLSGRFNPQTVQARRDAKAGSEPTLTWGQPYLAVVVSDARGLIRPPTMRWAGRALQPRSGSALSVNAGGVHAELPEGSLLGDGPLAFELALSLRGMDSLGLVPAALNAELSVQADWPHPRFEGLFPPARREISEQGFTAHWETNQFASNIVSRASECARGDCNGLLANSLGVSLIEPVNIYSQAQRSTQYGMLFIGLSFIAFFTFEVLRRLPVHPIQYTLVGLSLAVFYLLLLSLAEHLGFALAYLLAALSCVSLLGFYLRYVLRSATGAALFAALLSGLYGLLYLIVQAEDYALLGGSILVFGVLAAVMVLTRHVDWYAVAD